MKVFIVNAIMPLGYGDKKHDLKHMYVIARDGEQAIAIGKEESPNAIHVYLSSRGEFGEPGVVTYDFFKVTKAEAKEIMESASLRKGGE